MKVIKRTSQYSDTEPLYTVVLESGDEISIQNGNDKLGPGVYNINLLSGDDKISVTSRGLLTDVPGTCSGCCDSCKQFCYDRALTKYRHNTCIPSRAKNTLIMRASLDTYFEQIKNFCLKKRKDPVKIFRYHSGGEIETYEYLLKMVEVAKDCPDVKFYFYTKRFAWLQKYLDENGSFPENLVPNVSVWKHNADAYELKGLNRFIYDDGTDPELAAVTHCPAVDKDGHETGVKCAYCGRCSRQTGKATAVYSH